MRVPKYRKHSTRNYAFVEWQGRRHRLPGRYNSASSRAAYNRFLADNVYSTPNHDEFTYRPPEGHKLYIAGLVLAFLDYAQRTYPDSDNRKSTYHTLRRICTAFSEEYGQEFVRDFGPLKLKEYQRHLVEEDCARSYVNKRIGVIKQMFKWGVSEELVPVTIYQSIATVAGLRRGRTAARDNPPRHPVAWKDVEATLPYLNPIIHAMVLVQWHTGCRSDSLCNATPGQFDRSSEIWLWKPKHKTDYLGKEVILPIGPKCQKILMPFLDRADDAFLFNPQEGRNGSNWRYRTKYDTDSYRQAVKRAQTRAIDMAKARGETLDLSPWTPHHMRHAKATLIRKQYGIEAARIMLGHTSADVTAIYAERDLETAKRIASETG